MLKAKKKLKDDEYEYLDSGLYTAQRDNWAFFLKELRYIHVHLKHVIEISALLWQKEQVTKVTFPVKEQNVSVISTDVNGIISGCLTSRVLVFMHKI